MAVILFPLWPVYTYIDENGVNIVHRWFRENDVSSAIQGTLQSYIDLVSASGPEAIVGAVRAVNGGFEAFYGKRKAERGVYLVFNRSTFTEYEITIVAASFSPKDCLAEARRNLRTLERLGTERRKYEPVIGRIARNFSR